MGRLILSALLSACVCACCPAAITSSTRAPESAPRQQEVETAVVKRGDTLYGIAKAHGAKVSEIAAWNSLVEPFTIKPGQRLMVTSKASLATAATTLPMAGTPSVDSMPLPPNGNKQGGGESQSLPGAERKDAAMFGFPTVAGVMRPLRGGPLGVEISDAEGGAILAIADGMVLYSGPGSPGYEELIVIQHDNDWLTSYARNGRRLVAEGRRVSKGEKIAEVGRSETTGAVHIEMRHNGTIVDPLSYLPTK